MFKMKQLKFLDIMFVQFKETNQYVLTYFTLHYKKNVAVQLYI